MTGANGDQPVQLPETEVARLKRTVAAHRNDPETGACRICRTKRCHAYVTADGTLKSAGVRT